MSDSLVARSVLHRSSVSFAINERLINKDLLELPQHLGGDIAQLALCQTNRYLL